MRLSSGRIRTSIAPNYFARLQIVFRASPSNRTARPGVGPCRKTAFRYRAIVTGPSGNLPEYRA